MSGPGIGVCRCRAFSRSLSGGAGRAREFLAAVEGLTRVEMDCRDGSLLLEYDTSRLGHADLFLLSLRLEALVRQGQVLPHGGLLALRGGASPPERALPACSSVRAFRDVPCLRRLRASGGVRRFAAGAFCGRGPRGGRSGFCRAPRAFDVARAAGPMSAAVFPAESRMAGAWRSAGTSPRHDLHFSGRSRAEPGRGVWNPPG